MKFNTQSEGIKAKNLCGGVGYFQAKEQEFLDLILSSFLSDQTYRTGDQALTQLKTLISEIEDKKFLAQAATFARHIYGMRSVSHVVAAELAKYASGQDWSRDFYRAVVRRPDDMTEILAYYFANNGKKLSNAIKAGFKSAFDKFDTYQIAKYRAEDKAVSLVDVANLVHPVPTERNGAGLKGLIGGTLKAEGTWEYEFTLIGQNFKTEAEKSKARAEKWNELIVGKRLGYLALLRNLRNIVEQAPESVDVACEQLTNDEAIARSLVFPFQFLTAYRQFKMMSATAQTVGLIQKVMTAISTATMKAVFNVPTFEGSTLVVMDNSGSMSGPLAARQKNRLWSMAEAAPGEVKMKDVAALFGVALAITNKADFMVFGTDAKYYPLNLNGDILATVEEVSGSNIAHRVDLPYYVGHGTDFGSIFRKAGKAYDRIIILTDVQGNGTTTGNAMLETYKTQYSADPFVYEIDLAGYGTTQFPGNKVFKGSGFSDKLFSFMQMFESDKTAVLDSIRAVNISEF